MTIACNSHEKLGKSSESQKRLIKYQSTKIDSFDILNRHVKNTVKRDFLRSAISKHRRRIKASQILKKIEFDIIAKAVFNINEKNKRRNHRYSKESLIKTIIWQKVCNIKRTTFLISILFSNKEIAGNLGFEQQIPSTTLFNLTKSNFLKQDHMKKIILEISKKIRREVRFKDGNNKS